MIVAVNVDPNSFRRIKEFVVKGKYESVQNFLEVAVLNQILLETGEATNLRASKESELPSKDEANEKVNQSKRQIGVSTSHFQYLFCPKSTAIPILLALPLNEEVRSHPIWGQINRLAPAKMVLRMLANQFLSGSDQIDLKRFSADAAEAATEIRTLIEKKDKKNRIRGTELYIALPKKDPSSQQRFINYYVGKLSTGKWTDGVLTGLGFVRIEQTDDGSVMVGLTDSGRTFGCSPSPLIDEFLLQGKQIEDPFSTSEVQYLLEYLRVNRPGEFWFMSAVLRLIKSGVNTPTPLRKETGIFLRNQYPAIKISDKFVNTMLVGLMGRLVEMRLVEITKDAQKSKYSLTTVGEHLIG